jgi:hypothetical protein
VTSLVTYTGAQTMAMVEIESFKKLLLFYLVAENTIRMKSTT